MKKIILLLLVLFLAAGCGPKSFYYGAQQQAIPQLVVQAEGIVQATPDQMQMRLGVVSEAEEAGPALEDNNQRMAAVMRLLADIGIHEDEMATGQFQIRPEWSRPPRPTPANWQRQIIGYRVNNELLVTSSQIKLAGELLSLAQRAGTNQIGGLQFGLADPTEYRQQAIEIATARAIRKAQTMAAAAGVRLGAVQSMTLDPSGHGPAPMLMAEARMATAEPVPVSAGQIDVGVSVTMIFHLQGAAAKENGSAR